MFFPIQGFFDHFFSSCDGNIYKLPAQIPNDFIALFKDTSVCSMIAVVELTGMYRFLFQSHPRLMLEFGVLTALLYLAMSYPLSLVARRMETRFKRVNT